MINIKKTLKIFTFVFVLVMCFSVVSMIDAATFNRGSTYVQFGWDIDTPEDGSSIETNSGAASYYRSARVDGKQAFCMDYKKRVPDNGSISKIGTLGTRKLAILYEGKKSGNPDATQLALWKECSGVDESRIEPTKYFQSAANVRITSSELKDLFADANDIWRKAQSHTASEFNSSKDVKITINKSQKQEEIQGDYYYKGPYIITSNSGNPITINIENNPSGILVVGSFGATTSLTKVPSNGIIFLKVKTSIGSGEQKINFSTEYSSRRVTGSIYSNGNSKYQRLATIEIDEEPGTAKASITIPWTLKGKIRIVKLDESTSKPLAGAVFSLYNSSKKVVQTKTTNSNGEIEFTDLEFGTYYIKETSAPDGYAIISSDFKKIVLQDSEEEVTVKNRPTVGKLRIVKRDDSNSKPLSGAVFSLYNSSKKVIQTKTTDSNGTIEFVDLDYGTYYVKEISAPQGYIMLNSDFEKLVINSNSTKSLEFENEQIKGRVKIKKYVEYDGVGTQAVGNGDAVFGIFKSNGTKVAEISTNSNGVATSDYLPMGSYYLKELSVNSGYMKLNPKIVSFEINESNNGQTIDLGEFINEGITGSIEIYKYTTENNKNYPIQGAKFEIYSGTSESDAQRITTITTNAGGKAYIDGLQDGNYLYREIYVPNGYKLDNTYKPFTISKTVKVVKANVYNQILYGKLNIVKVDEENKKPIEGVVFDIYASNKKTKVATITTDKNGKANVKLKYGTYYVKEVKAPSKVIMNTKEYKIVIGEGSDAKIEYNLEVTNKLIDLGIKLYKVDNEQKPISGVKFALYSDVEGKNQVATATTNSAGLALFEKLKEGTYYYKELSAPDGYITTKISQMKPIKIDYDTQPIYEETIVNEPILGQISVHKIDEENKPIAGVEFDIKDSNGNVVDHIITDKNGNAMSKKLRKGNYTLVETKVPAAYELLEDAIPFTINTNGQIAKEQVTNYYKKGKVKIKKVDADTKEFIDGAVFEIYKIEANGQEKLVDTIRNYNAKGVGTSQELKNGKYYLIETVAPPGAVIDSTRYEFEISDEQKVFEKTIENKVAKGQIELIKNDNTGTPIEGVIFQILAADKTTVIEELTTDKTGRAISSRIKIGTYYVKETYAPQNYVKITDLIKVEIKNDNQVITLKDEIVNTKINSVIKFIKNDDAGTPIAGVKFQILSSDKKTVIEEIVTDANGKATTKVKNVGTYYIKEIYTPDIYVRLTDLIKVEIKGYNDVITLQKEIVNKRITGGIRIIKKDDAGTPIAGVEFAVYKEGDAFPTATITTNEQGIATYTNLVVGKYYFVETKVPDNLYINTEKVSFEVTKKGELVEKTVVNERVKGKLVINKTNSENGTGIEGVTFEIYDSNKNLIGSIYTNSEGVATTEELKDSNGNIIPLYAGTYYYAETAAPSRFYFESTQLEFKITKGNENVTVNVQNTPFKIPQTGGFLGTDSMIVMIVSIVSIAGYIFGNVMINRRRFA